MNDDRLGRNVGPIAQDRAHNHNIAERVVIAYRYNMEMETDNNDGSSSRKRRHPSSVIAETTARNTTTSLELLELIETPNFEELARHYPAFQEAWKATRQRQKETTGASSFSSCVTQEFTVALTRGLLQTHLQLKLPYLDHDHLCPPVPNRFFYLHWIHTHLLLLSPRQPKRQQIWGMDLGMGATAIYPLLAARFFDCHMVASEVDKHALSLAKSNVTANQLDHKITLLEVPPSHSQQPSSLLPPGGPLERALTTWTNHHLSRQYHIHPQHCALDFVMTNPPFYDPASSMEHSTPRAGDGRARTHMTVSEGAYPNGEIGFVTEMLADSLRTTTTTTTRPNNYYSAARCWYSSMLGKKTSLIHLQKLLVRVLGPAHVETTEYGPGQYTRWFLAWTLERPLACAPSARCVQHASDSFQVTLSSLDDGNIYNIASPSEAVQEVVSRIVAFCESSPGGWDLTTTTTTTTTMTTVCGVSSPSMRMVQIQESMPLAVTHFVDESDPPPKASNSNSSIPQMVMEALQGRQGNSQLLPEEGHFVMQASVQIMATTNDVINVHLACYRHSSRGLKAIEKIRTGMEGEVSRTNRKWRRIRQRQQA